MSSSFCDLCQDRHASDEKADECDRKSDLGPVDLSSREEYRGEFLEFMWQLKEEQ